MKTFTLAVRCVCVCDINPLIVLTVFGPEAKPLNQTSPGFSSCLRSDSHESLNNPVAWVVQLCCAVASQFTSVCHRVSKEKGREGQAMMNVCVLCKADEAHHSPPESDVTPLYQSLRVMDIDTLVNETKKNN